MRDARPMCESDRSFLMPGGGGVRAALVSPRARSRAVPMVRSTRRARDARACGIRNGTRWIFGSGRRGRHEWQQISAVRAARRAAAPSVRYQLPIDHGWTRENIFHYQLSARAHQSDKGVEAPRKRLQQDMFRMYVPNLRERAD
jgi:hypothetical protein